MRSLRPNILAIWTVRTPITWVTSKDLLQIGPSLMQRAGYTMVIPYLEWVRAEAIRQAKLAFDDLVNQFNAAQNTPGVEENFGFLDLRTERSSQ